MLGAEIKTNWVKRLVNWGDSVRSVLDVYSVEQSSYEFIINYHLIYASTVGI